MFDSWNYVSIEEYGLWECEIYHNINQKLRSSGTYLIHYDRSWLIAACSIQV